MTPASALSRLEKLADKIYGQIPEEEFFGASDGGRGDYINGGRDMLALLSEPGEGLDFPDPDVCCCGDSMKNHQNAFDAGHMPVSALGYYLSCLEETSRKDKAALASSEARVRILTEAVKDALDGAWPDTPAGERARQALLEVQR